MTKASQRWQAISSIQGGDPGRQSDHGFRLPRCVYRLPGAIGTGFVHGEPADQGIGIWMFLATAALALLIALVTVSYQTVRAARGNPVDSFRYE